LLALLSHEHTPKKNPSTDMAASAALVFAGKSVATPAISFLINKAFSYIDEYFKSKHMDEVKNRLLRAMPQIQAVLPCWMSSARNMSGGRATL
jgi:hypothetical protein